MKTSKIVKEKHISAFEMMRKIINHSKTEHIEFDHLYYSIISEFKGKSETKRTTVQSYIKKLHASGFITREGTDNNWEFVKNAHIPECVKPQFIDRYAVILQDFDETDECKTGWELSSQDLMHQEYLYSLETIIMAFELDQILETDKYGNPEIVLYRKTIY